MINSKKMKNIVPYLFLLVAACVFVDFAAADNASRKWSDQSGKFEVEAKLIKFADGKVELLKEDGLAITVPLTVLSEADQKYVKELNDKTVDPFAGGAPAVGGTKPGMTKTTLSSAGLALLSDDSAVKELPTEGTEVFVKISEPVSSVEPDPSPTAPKFQQFLRAMEGFDAYARVSMPILIDPATSTYAVSAHRLSNAVADNEFGKIYLIQASQKTPKVVLNGKPTVKIIDHHVASGRSLVLVGVGDNTERGGDLVILDKLATGAPVALTRWHLPNWDTNGFKPQVQFGKLLDEQTALVRVNNIIYVWNLQTGELVYKINDLASGSKIRMSGTGKYLAIPASGGCRLIDLAKQELIGLVPFPSTLTPEVHFSPNGGRLAMTAGNQFVIWDLKEAAVSAEATIGKPCGDFFGWIGEKYILTSLGGLIDPELRMGVWEYGMPSGKRVITMPGGVVTLHKDYKMSSLVSMPIPHGPVASVIKKLSSKDASMLVVKPGTEVALSVKGIEGTDVDAIRAGLQAAVERAGWKVVQSSPIQVSAIIGRGKKRKMSFRSLGSPLFGGNSETVSITPYTAGLTVTKGKDLLWSRSSRSMVPYIIHMEKGESIKQAVKKYEKADPEFFKRLTFPPSILKPEISDSIGRSTIKEGAWSSYFPSDFR